MITLFSHLFHTWREDAAARLIAPARLPSAEIAVRPMKVLSLFLVIAAAAIPARAQECCRVEGSVRDARGAPMPNADIVLVGPDAKAPREGKTTDAGTYAFTGIRPGIRVEVRVMQGGRPIASAFTLVTSFVETLDIKALPEIAAPAGIDDLDPMGGAAGEIRGVVRAAGGTPIAGARVAIGGTPEIASTDSTGRYSFGPLRAKLAIDLQVSASGFETATQEVTVPDGASTDADFALTARPATASATGLDLADAIPDRRGLTISRDAIDAVPSLTPRDAFRAARVLPAAAVGVDESQLFVHGAPPDQTYVNLDGIPWYAFPRLSAGLTAPIDTTSVQTTSLPGEPADVDGGGRLGGVLRLATLRPAGRVFGQGDVGVFGPGGTVAVPIATIGSAMIAGRHSWPASVYEHVLDRFAGPDVHYVRDRDVQYDGGVLAAALQPAFSQLNGRVELAPGKGNRAYVSFYHASDAGNFSRDARPASSSATLAAPDPLAVPADAVMQIGDVQSWTGQGVSAVWERQWSADVSTTATVARSRFGYTRDQAFDLTSASAGQDPSFDDLRSGSGAIAEQNTLEDTTIRITAAVSAGFRHAIEAGVERAALDTMYDGRSEFAAALVPLLARTASAALSSAFAQDVWRPTARLTVSPGVRLTYDDLTAASYADPRAAASYAAAPGVVFKGSWSIDHQAVSRVDREDREHGDGAFWTVSDGTTVPVARSQQVAAGATVERPGVLFDAHVYYRTLEALSLFAPRLLPGTSLTNPASAWHTGTGTAAGVEMVVQQRLARNTLWVSYAGGRVDYSYPTLEAQAFPASFERTNQVKVIDSMRLRGAWTVTGVWLAATGLPYTPSTKVQQVWFASGALAYQPLFDEKNSGRLPAYHQLDLSSQIAHHFGSVATTLGVTVFNVYDRQNVATNDFEAAGLTAIDSQTQLMRRAANVFFRVGF